MLKSIELKIRKITKERGWSLKYLCEKAGVTQTGINYIFENGSMKVDLLIKIAEILQIPISSFFEDNNLSRHNVISHQVGQGNINAITGGNLNVPKGNAKSSEKFETLKERVKSLEAQLELKDEIIDLLKQTNKLQSK